MQIARVLGAIVLNQIQYLKRYGVAIAAVAIAVLLMLALDPILQSTKAPFLLFFGAVVLSAFYGGRNSGLVATLLSAFLANYLFLEPQYGWALDLGSGLRTGFFLLQGVLVSVLIGALRTAQAQVRRNVGQLETTEAEVKDLNRALQHQVEDLQTLAAVHHAAEDRYRILVESMDEGFCICRMLLDQDGKPFDYRYVEINPVFEALTGLEQAIGKTARELVPELEDVWFEIYGKVAVARESIRFEQQSVSMNRWFDVYAFPIGEPESCLFGVLFTNITARKRREANAAFLAEITADLSRLSTADEIMQTIGAKVGAYLNITNCLFGEIDEAQDQATVMYSWHMPDTPDLVGVYRLSDFITQEFLQAVRSGGTVIIYDTQADPRTDKDRYATLMIHAFVTVPFHRHGEWRYIFSINDRVVRNWQDDEIKLIHEITNQIFPRLERARVEAALRQGEKQLQAANERFRLAAKAVNCLIYDWDVASDRVERTDGLTKLFGYSLEEAESTGQWWADRIHPDDLQTVLEQAWSVLAEHDQFSSEYRILNKSNQYVYVLDHCLVAARDLNGKPTRIVGCTTNITDRKRVEEELRQKNAILNVINESAPTPIFVKDRQGRFIYVNPATLAVLGKSATEVIGYRDCDVYSNPDAAVDVMENDRRIMESGQMEVVEESPDGIRTFLGMKVPYRNESGQVIGLIGISNDISERVRIERDREGVLQQEQAAREAAEAANRIKDEFLAILSHELRSPLNPILGWARLLQSQKLDETRTKHALATIERNARLQTQLIEDLLDVAKILRGKLSLDDAPINLASAIEAALEVVRTAAEAKSISLVAHLTDIGQVRGDNARLQQIVWNLLANAIKFTPVGGRVEVTLEGIRRQGLETREKSFISPQPLAPDPAYAQVTVTDTGKGINPEFLPYIFESFRQEDTSITRQHGGLGLGLSIVKYLVDAHGGTITADSPGDGQGATFTVRLPLLEDQTFFPATIPLSPAEINLSGIRVLAVDDNEDTRELLITLLTEYGAEARVVASGEEVLALLDSFEPNALVCDIGMPDMDGYTLLKRIRALPDQRGGQVPAIAVTAYTRDKDRQRALDNGFQKHIAKPIEPKTLAIAVAELALK